MRAKDFHSLEEMQNPFLPQTYVSLNATYEPLAYENFISHTLFFFLTHHITELSETNQVKP